MKAAMGLVQVTSVVCPAWCDVTQESHLADLQMQSGIPVHLSEDRKGDDWALFITGSAYADGTPYPKSPPSIHIESHPDVPRTPEGARKLADAVLAAVKEIEE